MEESDFWIAKVESSSGSGLHYLNEFSLKGEPILRLSIRWVNDDGYIDYEKRNYYCLYADYPAEGLLEFAQSVREQLEETHGEEWFEEILRQVRDYLPADYDVCERDFPEIAQSLLAITFENPVPWKAAAARGVIESKSHAGHEGHHLDVVWHQYNAPGSLALRLVNSWENEPIYQSYIGPTVAAIVPKEYLALTEPLEPQF